MTLESTLESAGHCTIEKTASLHWIEERWEIISKGSLKLASHFMQGVRDKSGMVYCYWLIVSIWSWLDREIGISGRYNLLFLMCLITPGEKHRAKSDTSSELIYTRTASFFWDDPQIFYKPEISQWAIILPKSFLHRSPARIIEPKIIFSF